ncbi:MAG TPA: hypothetical protein DEA44_03645, partial [Firmicutes bacterium]|nr:hypothetical protein [Bacillota bacterium]
GMGGMGGASPAASAPASGAYVPLGEVVDFRVVDGPSMISSENSTYRVIVQFNARGRDVVSVVNEAEKAIRSQVDL